MRHVLHWGRTPILAAVLGTVMLLTTGCAPLGSGPATITGLDTRSATLVVDIANSDSDIAIDYSVATIIRADSSVGSEADLGYGMAVAMSGIALPDGTLVADTIQIL